MITWQTLCYEVLTSSHPHVFHIPNAATNRKNWWSGHFCLLFLPSVWFFSCCFFTIMNLPIFLLHFQAYQDMKITKWVLNEQPLDRLQYTNLFMDNPFIQWTSVFMSTSTIFTHIFCRYWDFLSITLSVLWSYFRPQLQNHCFQNKLIRWAKMTLFQKQKNVPKLAQGQTTDN